VFDITWITDAIAGQTAGETQPIDVTQIDSETSSGERDNNESIAALKAGRASRAGTKAGRIVRIVRLIRLVRLVKLHKQREKLKGNVIDENVQAFDMEPSRVGKRLSELTTIRIIILILMMILILPFIDNSSINEPYAYQSQLIELESLHKIPQSLNTSDEFTLSTDFLIVRTHEYVSQVDFTILDISIVHYDEVTVKSWLSSDKDSKDATGKPHWKTNFRTGFAENQAYIDKYYRDDEYVQVDAYGCYNSSNDKGGTIDEPKVNCFPASCEM
jgi:hypothetical protein